MSQSSSAWRAILIPAVLVSALGYFVDVYDLLLFSIVRTPSLQSLGDTGQALINHGLLLLNLQMAGMLLGGIFWGILGDRRGRVQILFGSILLYSVANLANGFVHSIPGYAVWRFIAGVGLAGELGGGITLVCEVLPKESRACGTTLVAAFGVLGAVAAALVGGWIDWRLAYILGGVLGLTLLALRLGVAESGMLNHLKEKRATVSRGNFVAFLTCPVRSRKYLCCILLGLPTWFIIGILVTLSPEFAVALRITGPVKAAYAVLSLYSGISLGDLLSGFLSHRLGSRKKVLGGFLCAITAFLSLYFLIAPGRSPAVFYGLIGLLGIGAGYWAVLVTVAAEQFGTNIRATVATTIPNFIRGAVIPITMAFLACKEAFGLLPGGIAVGLTCVALALLGLRGIEETHGKDLDYHEPI